MTKLFLAAGVAALAIAVPASAKPDKGGGPGGGGKPAKFEGGGGGGGKPAKAERGGGGGGQMKAQKAAARRFEQPMKQERQVLKQRDKEFRQAAKAQQKFEKRAFKSEQKFAKQQDKLARQEFKQREKLFKEQDRLDDRFVEQRRFDDFDRDRFESRFGGLGFNGCPPGLVSINGGCMPPGQYRKMMTGQMLPAQYSDSLLPLELRDLYRDTDDYYYRYGDGYAYRVDRDTNLIEALLPLLGGGYSVGQMFPTSFANSFVPDYYRPFYQDRPDSMFRYGNGYIYQVDPRNGLIENIIPAYANGYGVGDILPPSYSYYNVPNQYRSFYPETDDYSYRYGPGAIYQVDRQTSLITAIASLLSPGLSLGQQLPMGFDAYNVPYQYRSRYYDTPTSMYRYSNGSIYQVDPTTRLITAVISALI